MNISTLGQRFMNEIFQITKKIDIFVLNIIPTDTTKILSKCH